MSLGEKRLALVTKVEENSIQARDSTGLYHHFCRGSYNWPRFELAVDDKLWVRYQTFAGPTLMGAMWFPEKFKGLTE